LVLSRGKPRRRWLGRNPRRQGWQVADSRNHLQVAIRAEFGDKCGDVHGHTAESIVSNQSLPGVGNRSEKSMQLLGVQISVRDTCRPTWAVVDGTRHQGRAGAGVLAELDRPGNMNLEVAEEQNKLPTAFFRRVQV